MPGGGDGIWVRDAVEPRRTDHRDADTKGQHRQRLNAHRSQCRGAYRSRLDPWRHAPTGAGSPSTDPAPVGGLLPPPGPREPLSCTKSIKHKEAEPGQLLEGASTLTIRSRARSRGSPVAVS